MDTNISVVIITKDRHLDLIHCLASLISQKSLPDEIIVIDNSSSKKTKKTVENFVKNTEVPIKYIYTSKSNLSSLRNIGMSQSEFGWISFIDDDCVADVGWMSEIRQGIKKYPSAAALLGKSLTFYHKNSLALSTYFLNMFWIQNRLSDSKIIDLEILDTKNLTLNMNYLKNTSLRFDESLKKLGVGLSEDCDLGMQIQEKDGVAYYLDLAKVKHKDTTDWLLFTKKLAHELKDHYFYINKWSGYRKKNVPKYMKKYRLLMYLFHSSEFLSLQFIQKMVVISICYTVALISKFYYFYRSMNPYA